MKWNKKKRSKDKDTRPVFRIVCHVDWLGITETMYSTPKHRVKAFSSSLASVASIPEDNFVGRPFWSGSPSPV